MNATRATDLLLRTLFKSTPPSTDVLAALISLNVPVDWMSQCPAGSSNISSRNHAGLTLLDYALASDATSGTISGLLWSTLTKSQTSPLDIHAPRSWPDKSNSSLAERALVKGYWPLISHWLTSGALDPAIALSMAKSPEVLAQSLETEWWNTWSSWSAKIGRKQPATLPFQPMFSEWTDHRTKYLWLTVKTQAELVKIKPTHTWTAHDAAVWLKHVCGLGGGASWQWGVLVSKPDQPKQQTSSTARPNTSRPWTLIEPDGWIDALSAPLPSKVSSNFAVLPYAAECIKEASSKLGETSTKDTWEALLQSVPIERMPRLWILEQLSKNAPQYGSPTQFENLLTYRLLTSFVDHPETPATWDSVRDLSAMSLFSVLGPFHKKMVSWSEAVVANTRTYPWHLPEKWWNSSTTPQPNPGKILASAVLAITPDVLAQESSLLEDWLATHTKAGSALLKAGDIERLADATAVTLQRCGDEAMRPILAQLLWTLVLKCPPAKQTEWLTKMSNAHIDTPDKNRLRVLYELPHWDKLLPEVQKIPKQKSQKIQSYLDQLVLTNSVATPSGPKTTRRM